MKNDKITHQIISISEQGGGKVFEVSIQIPMQGKWIDDVYFSVATTTQRNDFRMNYSGKDETYAYFKRILYLETCAIYHYHFSYTAEGEFCYYKKTNLIGDNEITPAECWKLSVKFSVSEKVKGAIMYHIFVDRYRRGSKEKPVDMPDRYVYDSWESPMVLGPDEQGRWNIDYYGGDFKGITETLRYLKKLGVTMIYLSPIPESQSNHRYDTGDYRKPDPYAGTEDGIKELCREAHKLGMRIMLDVVFNHTGNISRYFNEKGTYDSIGAYQGWSSPYMKFYKRVWNPETEKVEFVYWYNFPNMPVCNGYSEELQEFHLGKNGTIDLWYSWGTDDIRVDVMDELCDVFIRGLRTAIKRNNPDAFMLAEVWKQAMRTGRSYLESGEEMDAPMNYQLVDALVGYFNHAEVDKLYWKIYDLLTEYPEDTIKSCMNFTSTHDISRGVEIFVPGAKCFKRNGEWKWNLVDESVEFASNHQLSDAEYKAGRRVYMAYVFTLYFWPGIVSIFYGDEVGARGIGNLANRCPYPWKRRDKKLLKYFRELGAVRTKEIFLREADTRVVEIDEEKFVFERFDENSKMLVAVSRVDYTIELKLPEEYERAEVVYALNPHGRKDVLNPYGGIAMKLIN